jgi:hypothetical protein
MKNAGLHSIKEIKLGGRTQVALYNDTLKKEAEEDAKLQNISEEKSLRNAIRDRLLSPGEIMKEGF